MDADGSHERNLTHSAGTETNPSFSSDGTQIFYHLDNELDSIPVDGGSPTTIISPSVAGRNADQPAESPDGTKIAFADLQGDIWVYDELLTTVLQLTYYGSFTNNPTWSPDGSRIYFQHLVDGKWRIESIVPDGDHSPVVLVNDAQDQAPSPDGKNLSYVGQGSSIYITDADGGNPAVVPGLSGNHFDLAWQNRTGDGTLIGSGAEARANGVDLTAAGTEDWAVWGHGSKNVDNECIPGPGDGPIAPTVRKAGGADLISDLTNLQGTPGYVDCFGDQNPFSFSWSDGTAAEASNTYVGISHSSHDVGDAYRFSVPATPTEQQLKVWLYSDGGEGTLRAHLSDGGATDYVYSLPASATTNNPLVVTLTFSSPNPDASLQVSWTLDSAAPTGTPPFGRENAAVFAAALSGGADPGGGGTTQDGPTFTVNSSADTDDGQCTDTDCTLREAIDAANNHENDGGPDKIQFVIPGFGLQTIQPAGALPEITDPVVIDGTTQTDYLGSPLVFIDGVAAYCDICTVDGLHVAPSGSGSTIRGVAIGNFSGDGIELEGNDAGSVIESSWIGIDPTPNSGGYAGNDGSGIRISNSSGNRIGGTSAGQRVVLGANTGSSVGSQIAITGASSSGNTVEGSNIGGRSDRQRRLRHGNRRDDLGRSLRQHGWWRQLRRRRQCDQWVL